MQVSAHDCWELTMWFKSSSTELLLSWAASFLQKADEKKLPNLTGVSASYPKSQAFSLSLQWSLPKWIILQGNLRFNCSLGNAELWWLITIQRSQSRAGQPARAEAAGAQAALGTHVTHSGLVSPSLLRGHFLWTGIVLTCRKMYGDGSHGRNPG